MLIKRSISKVQISALPRVVFPGRIEVVQSVPEMERAVRYLEKQTLVGIDTETRPCFKKHQTFKVSLLQVSTADICFLFRLNMIGIPDALVRFLENPNILKVGLSLVDDVQALLTRREFDMQSLVELQGYVKSFGILDSSLQKLYAILFGEKISKSQQLSNWEADVLSDAQKMYAAIDAWACYKIYTLLEELKRTGNYEIEEIIETEET